MIMHISDYVHYIPTIHVHSSSAIDTLITYNYYVRNIDHYICRVVTLELRGNY